MEKMSPPAARPSSALMPRRGPLGFVLLLMLVLAICTASAQPSVHPRVDESGVALRRFIIGYKEGRGPTGSRAGYRGNARFLSRDTEVELLELPDYLTADEVDAVQNEIHLDDSVEYVELDRAVFLGSSSASDEDFSSDDDSYRRPLYDSERMWGLVRAGAPGAWNAAFTGDTGSETVVCIIDTGIEASHPDLQPNIWVNEVEANGIPGVDDDGNGYIDDIHGIDATTNTGALIDTNGHGTHVAGIIAASGYNSQGVLGAIGSTNKIKVMGCRFMGETSWLSDAIKCMDYAITQGVAITVNSWGWTGGSSQAFARMLVKAHYADQLFIAAAGNGGQSIDISSQAHWPASYPYGCVLSVANTDKRDRLQASSNYGRYTVDIAAPGTEIWSTYPMEKGGYRRLSGTSMAAPLVAGAAALLRSRAPMLAYTWIKYFLMFSGERLDTLEGVTVSGQLLQVDSALAAVMRMIPAMPAPTPSCTPTPTTPATTPGTTTPASTSTAAPLPTTPAQTPVPPTPAPSPATTPAPSTLAPTSAPTPSPSTPALTPAPTSVAPTTAPTAVPPTPAPTPSPTTPAPTPSPTTPASTLAPTPVPTTPAPTPSPTMLSSDQWDQPFCTYRACVASAAWSGWCSMDMAKCAQCGGIWCAPPSTPSPTPAPTPAPTAVATPAPVEQLSPPPLATYSFCAYPDCSGDVWAGWCSQDASKCASCRGVYCDGITPPPPTTTPAPTPQATPPHAAYPGCYLSARCTGSYAKGWCGQSSVNCQMCNGYWCT
mmetsp:Transcript_10691/g.27419  ORF Transcript_10691/g.27419 Transcript_10691/m.27419 type:complete len:770 (+) Transcript_10691:448-2757(+)